MCNNPNIDLVHINAYEKFGPIPSICSQDIELKRNSDDNQGLYSVVNLQNRMGNNPDLDLVEVKAHAKFDQNPSISSQDIERKGYSDNNQGP